MILKYYKLTVQDGVFDIGMFRRENLPFLADIEEITPEELTPLKDLDIEGVKLAALAIRNRTAGKGFRNVIEVNPLADAVLALIEDRERLLKTIWQLEYEKIIR